MIISDCSNILIICSYGPPEFGLERFYENAFRSLGYNVCMVAAQEKLSFFSKGEKIIKNKIAQLTHRGFPPNTTGTHLINLAKELQPYLTIVVRGENLIADAIMQLNDLSLHGCINIYPDYPFVIPGKSVYQLNDSLGSYRAVFIFSKNLVPIFYQLGAKRVEWMPFAYDPLVHVQHSSKYLDTPCCYLGTWGPIQEYWLEPLVTLGLKIYGGGWHHLSKKSMLRSCWVENEGTGPRMTNVIARSKIVFNMVRAEAGCAHSMKTFEIPACGGFMLTNWTEEQEIFFQGGKDCVFFNSKNDFLDKVNYYLANDDEREKIRINGIQKVSQHTYENRVKMILDCLKK